MPNNHLQNAIDAINSLGEPKYICSVCKKKLKVYADVYYGAEFVVEPCECCICAPYGKGEKDSA